ncbi:MAG: divalent metal cation transporter [Flavobacteriaceae bacterium]|nr:divalent metal cation transporter [Flavobacteriaceae bacterium]
MKTILQKLGPGLLFAGAAIGVSHLVQSTRAGADFSLGLLWALFIVHFFKYPFFQYGPRYAAATGESLLDGYKKIGKWALALYFLITFATMFTIQTAVTIVTAGLAKSILGSSISLGSWSAIILVVCIGILRIGQYKLLDKAMKFIIVLLSISTVAAVIMATSNANGPSISWIQHFPIEGTEIAFLIAFMGWMPAPLDISVWHSLWALEKQKNTKNFSSKNMLMDFNIGFVGTLFLGITFMLLGALVMYGSPEGFDSRAGIFAQQLIDMYTSSLGNWAYLIIGLAAFTTMFSTTLTTLDASPRSMGKTTSLLFNFKKNNYFVWIIILAIGTMIILTFFISEMGMLVKIATIVSFLTAPFYAILNFVLIRSKHTPKAWQPSKIMQIWSAIGIVFLIAFSIWYLIQ